MQFNTWRTSSEIIRTITTTTDAILGEMELLLLREMTTLS
jgi:hypothetical protein